MNKCSLALGVQCVAACRVALAGDLDSLQNLSQSQFQGLAKDATSAFSYKSASPAEPLGVTGFDIGLTTSRTGLKNTAAWEAATSGSDTFSHVYLPRLQALKGLPLGIDVGVM